MPDMQDLKELGIEVGSLYLFGFEWRDRDSCRMCFVQRYDSRCKKCLRCKWKGWWTVYAR